MSEFFKSSSEAITEPVKLIGKAKYPWKNVPVGMSFPVPRENIQLNVLKSLASTTGIRLGKFFRVVDHGHGPYEVACVRLREGVSVAQAAKTSGQSVWQQQPSMLIDALNKEKDKEE